MKKTLLKYVAFAVVLIAVLACTYRIMSFKYADGNQIIVDFYGLEKNTVDVLFLGSSHAYTNFNNGTLWSEYGISSYNLGSSEQPLWNTYYYLKEALKTQTPKLIVLEGYGTAFNFDYSADSRVVKNIYGMKWSKNRLDAIDASVKPEDKLSILLDYSRFHSRYSYLNKGDFCPNSNYVDDGNYMHYAGLMGQCLLSDAFPNEIDDFSNISESIDLWPKTEEYYRKIIELAKGQNIPIAVIIVPYQLSEDAHKYFLSAAEIAEEYNVPFFDFSTNINETGIDISSDYHDTCHLTAAGSAKFSKFVGEMLKDEFSIPDHRGDVAYDAWNRAAEITEHLIDKAKICNEADLDEYKVLLNKHDYVVFASANGYYSNDDLVNLIHRLGVDNVMAVEGACVLKGGELIWTGDANGAEYFMETKDCDILITEAIRDNKFEYSILTNNDRNRAYENGLNVVVYDSTLDEVIDSVWVKSSGEINR